MTPRALKDEVYERVARVAKALASPKRVELLDLLAQAERPVEWLAEAAAISVANTSRHLQVLHEARLVERRKVGTYVHYRVASPAVGALGVAVREVATERDAEIDALLRAYFGDRGALDPVTLAELRDRIDRDEVLVLDVRPAEEYAAGHVPGARSVPLAELDARLAALPRDRAVVAYCRGPLCVFADEAAHRLRAAGFDARRLDVGLPEWRAAGLTVGTA